MVEKAGGESLAPMKGSRHSSGIRILGGLLLIVAFVWIAYLLARDWQELREGLAEWSWSNTGWLSLSLGLLSLSLLPNFYLYRILFESHTQERFPFLMPVYFSSQVVRYLPGRFFGVVYQIAEFQNRASAFAVVRTNLEQMFIYFGGNFIVSVGILLLFEIPPWLAIGLALTGIACLLWMLNASLPNRVIQILTSRFPSRFEKYREVIGSHQPFSFRQNLQFFTLFVLSWIIYLAAWVALGNAIPGMVGGIDSLVHCAHYTLSWIVGFVSLVTPSGLGVRESVFIFLNQDREAASTLAFLAIVLRFWLMAADLLLLCLVQILFVKTSRVRYAQQHP
jgi:hypothetical protein